MKSFFALTILFSIFAQAEPFRLTPEIAIQHLLESGLDKKIVDSSTSRSDYQLTQTEGAFDPSLYGTIGQKDSKAETIGSTPNKRDLTKTWTLGLQKKWKTGTTLSAERGFTDLNSDIDTLNPSTANRLPQQYQDTFSLTAKQELLGNSFGVNDRRRVESAEFLVEKAQLDRKEKVEDLILLGLQYYWNAYAAQKNLEDAMAAREKYKFLVQNVEKKSRLGFDDKSDLSKTKAELQNREKNVKSASLNYLTALDLLFTLMNKPTPPEVTFVIKDERPVVPNIEKDPELVQLRKVKSANYLEQSTLLDRKIAQNSILPTINLVARATYYGVDEVASKSLSEMSSGSRPEYYLGLEFVYKFGSDQLEGEKKYRLALEKEAEVQKSITMNYEWDNLKRTLRNLQSKYIIVQAAHESVKLWEKAIAEQEKNHRHGRITTAELIMDYSNYFNTRSAYSFAVADYQLVIYEYKAARDKLITDNNADTTTPL